MRQERVFALGAKRLGWGAVAAATQPLQFAAACREHLAGGAGWQPAYADKLPALPKTFTPCDK